MGSFVFWSITFLKTLEYILIFDIFLKRNSEAKYVGFMKTSISSVFVNGNMVHVTTYNSTFDVVIKVWAILY